MIGASEGPFTVRIRPDAIGLRTKRNLRRPAPDRLCSGRGLAVEPGLHSAAVAARPISSGKRPDQDSCHIAVFLRFTLNNLPDKSSDEREASACRGSGSRRWMCARGWAAFCTGGSAPAAAKTVGGGPEQRLRTSKAPGVYRVHLDTLDCVFPSAVAGAATRQPGCWRSGSIRRAF